MTNDGLRPVPYDRLLIAVGGAPFIPPGIQGLGDNDGIFTFTKFSDAVALRRAAEAAESAVVLGGGLIGLQCAEGLAHLGKRVTVVEIADSVLPLALDRPSADLIAGELRAEGIAVRTGDTIQSIEGRGRRIEAVALKSGDRIPCSIVVIAIGVRPNVAFLSGSGVAIDRGILVDPHMETNIPGVYAAGDCAQAEEITTRWAMAIPVIPVATGHGMIAGYNMAGCERTHPGSLALNAFQFGRIPGISYGFVRDETDAEVLTHHDPQHKVYKKVILKDNRVTAAIFLRAIDRAGIFRHLIEGAVDVGPFKDRLLDDGFNFAHLPKEERDRLFTRPQ